MSMFDRPKSDGLQNSQLMIVDDSNLIEMLYEIVKSPHDTQDSSNILGHMYSRYDAYAEQYPEEVDEFRSKLLGISRGILDSFSKHFDLIVPEPDMEFDRLRQTVYQLYQLFIVHRNDIIIYFLSQWLPINWTRIYDFTNTRCTDVMYEHLKKTNPQNAALIYKIHDVMDAITSYETNVPDYTLMQDVICMQYPFLDTSLLAMYFGYTNQEVRVAVGRTTFYKFLKPMIDGPNSSELRTSLITAISSRGLQ
jgi:hypothetical protein